MSPDLSYTPNAKSSKGETGNIITFAQFKEGGLLSKTRRLLSETREDTESGNEYDDHSTILPSISEEEMDAMSSGNEYDAEPMSTEMLEDICGSGQSHTIIHRREARYKIHHRIKQIKA